MQSSNPDSWYKYGVNEIPSIAFVGGYVEEEEQPNQSIFVARAKFEGDQIPGKVIPAQENAFISYGGKEVSCKDDFEVLVGKNFYWENFNASFGEVPEGAVIGGYTKDGEPLYVGKAHIKGTDSIGKIQLSHGSGYFPLDGEELNVPSCSILIRGKEGDWLSASSGDIPSSAFPAGVDHEDRRIYVCRSWHEDHQIPGKVVPSHKVAYVSYDGQEHAKEDYEVLCGDGYFWSKLSNGYDPIPKNAVPGGQQADGEVLYIGRAKHEGVDVCGKIHPSHHTCFIPYAGKEVSINYNFDVLCFRN